MEPIEIKIGRKVSIGNEKPINLKEILKNTDYLDEQTIEQAYGMDPVLLAGIQYAVSKNMLTPEMSSLVISAIEAGEKDALNTVLKFTYDKEDLSKGVWVGNIDKRRKTIDFANKYEEKGLSEPSIGEFEPNPFKRLMNRIRRPRLGKSKEIEQNTEETEIVNETKEKETKNAFREGMNVVSKYDKAVEILNNKDLSMETLKELKDLVVQGRENGEIDEEKYMELSNRINTAETAKTISPKYNKVWDVINSKDFNMEILKKLESLVVLISEKGEITAPEEESLKNALIGKEAQMILKEELAKTEQEAENEK